MGALEEKLEQAAIRSRDQVTATITEVAYEDSGSERIADGIEVTYRIADTDGTSIEATDSFAVPETKDESYDFVTLCEVTNTPFASAHEGLVGCSTTATWEDGDWTLAIHESARQAERAAEGTDDGMIYRMRDSREWLAEGHAIGLAGLVAIALLFPLVAPFFFLDRWVDDGVVPALAGVVGRLVVWAVVAGGLWWVATVGVPAVL